ncbi:hypothetical protein [Bradyrhizobium sp.]|jgi:hypothetical protein|nr:hypothetical protein [Bradyrhizobium sp.]HEV2160567.1 hypothetical protein [Bradyrhizobium sp.]
MVVSAREHVDPAEIQSAIFGRQAVADVAVMGYPTIGGAKQRRR